VEIFAATNGLSFAKAIKLISKASGVSESCMWAWFSGDTRMPRFATIVAVVHATGKEVRIGREGLGYKPRFKVVTGGKKAA